MFNPKFSITVSIASALTVIERARGFLEAASLSESWISKMQNRALILEAHHTTHIEGTHLNLDQSKKLIEGQPTIGVDSDDAKELLNYTKAFEFVSQYVLSQGKITEGLIREIHSRLVSGVRHNSAKPGQYRDIQNYIANSISKEVIYTPPQPFEVPYLMVQLVEWLEAEISIPAILIAGISQFQLVHIHPFVDGNGRTARLLSTLCLYRSGYDFKKLFTISEYYDRNRQDYYNALQSVRENEKDMTGWLEYFCFALQSQMSEIQNKGSQAMKLDILANQNDLSERQKVALEFLHTEEDPLTIQKYELLCPGINRRTLQRDLADLIQKGLIVQEGEKRGTHYKMNQFL